MGSNAKVSRDGHEAGVLNMKVKGHQIRVTDREVPVGISLHDCYRRRQEERASDTVLSE